LELLLPRWDGLTVPHVKSQQQIGHAQAVVSKDCVVMAWISLVRRESAAALAEAGILQRRGKRTVPLHVQSRKPAFSCCCCSPLHRQEIHAMSTKRHALAVFRFSSGCALHSKQLLGALHRQPWPAASTIVSLCTSPSCQLCTAWMAGLPQRPAQSSLWVCQAHGGLHATQCAAAAVRSGWATKKFVEASGCRGLPASVGEADCSKTLL